MHRKREPLAELSPAQLIALEHLIHGASVTQAAAVASVDRATLWRWRQDPAFQAKLQAGLRDILDNGRRLRQLNWLVADQLFHRTMTDEKVDLDVRLRAAMAVQRTMPQTVRLGEEEDPIGPVEAIEASRVKLVEQCLLELGRRPKQQHKKPKSNEQETTE